MSGGGGKGGGQTQSSVTQIPSWVREPAKRNLARAEQVQQMEYQPWTGPDVAAVNDVQKAAMQMNFDTANAFGMMPQGYQGVSATSGLPTATTTSSNGVSGYSSFPLYEQAVREAEDRDPRSAAIRRKLYS